MKNIIIKFALLLSLIIVNTWSQEVLHSSKRNPKESYQHAINRYKSKVRQSSQTNQTFKGSVLDIANKNLQNINSRKNESLNNFQNSRNIKARSRYNQPNMEQDTGSLFWGMIPALKNKAQLMKYFTDLRDERNIPDPVVSGFMRRISWLYPDDGCFVRASMMVNKLIKAKKILPFKIFIFGNLNVKTSNSPNGEVSWWYHVAPIYRIGNTIYVLDPSLNPHQPETLNDWSEKMMKDLTKSEVAICDSAAYVPSSKCQNNPDIGEINIEANNTQPYYLEDERSRLIQLKRDVDAELGNRPPWKLVQSNQISTF